MSVDTTRVKPAERPLDLQPGRDHDAIDIHRDRVQAQPRNNVRDHGRVQRLQPSTVCMVNWVSHRLTVRAVGSPRNRQNRRKTGSSAT
jgi:hypothetical protein